MDAAVQNSERASIGLNPLITTPLILFVTGYIIAAMISHSWEVAFIGFILGIIWMIFGAFGFINAVRGFFYHRAAKRAISKGLIVPSVVIRGMNCVGIAMFDKVNQKVFVNGAVYDYNDVASINWESGSNRTFVQINLRVGKRPAQRVSFLKQKSADEQGQLALNAMGWN